MRTRFFPFDLDFQFISKVISHTRIRNFAHVQEKPWLNLLHFESEKRKFKYEIELEKKSNMGIK